MKNIFNFFCIAIILASCAPKSYYQLYDVTPIQKFPKGQALKGNLFFEDEKCKITYDLWSQGGNIGFQFYNKTDETIYINLNESHFILNGFAYDYYKNRTYTSSKSNSATLGKRSTGSISEIGVNIYNNIQTNKVSVTNSRRVSASVGNSTSVIEASIISIPPQTRKIISEYSIHHAQITSCELAKYPKKKNIKTNSYSIKKSPIVFSNRITYTLKGEKSTFENEFFVSAITNYPEKQFFKYKYDEICGKKNFELTKYFKYDSPNKFYIKYKRKK